ncbi:MAG: hypothetical protein COA33_003565 [Fluviicola sp.]|nr:hypothetical protein [Fluviicola sp.]
MESRTRGKYLKKSYNSDLDFGIFHKGKSVTKNGHHSLIEIMQDGKIYVYDNLNPSGMLKTDYIQTLEISVGTKLYSKEAAYDLFKKSE